MGKEDIAVSQAENCCVEKGNAFICPQVQTVSGSESRWEMRDLNEDQEYEFWMTASTKVGEGKQTSRLLSLTSNSGDPHFYSFFVSL